MEGSAQEKHGKGGPAGGEREEGMSATSHLVSNCHYLHRKERVGKGEACQTVPEGEC